ncbi:MAG: hypothetical protein AB8B50_04675 [Pirellulaceae bacterium]
MSGIVNGSEKSDRDARLDWHITSRWHSYEGEVRTAIVRLCLILALYATHLVNYFAFMVVSDSNAAFHRSITLLAAAGLAASLGVLVTLTQRYFPIQLKFVVTSLDALLIFTAALLGDGANSPVVVCLFVLIGLATLRYSLPLVWFTTLLSVACYFALIGVTDRTWFDENHATPVIEQMIFGCSLVAAGFVAGQSVRMTRSAAEFYADRRAGSQPARNEPSDEEATS